MPTGTRIPSWRDRENNKRRQQLRRAVAAKIFAGLRLHGHYSLPAKHCDNNEVLKAVCNEAGWTVEPDGTTYRKGCKPVESMGFLGCSILASGGGSSSYNPPPASSSLQSPSYTVNNLNGNSLVPWLRNLSSGGSISAPVNTPFTSPTAQTPRLRSGPEWLGGIHSPTYSLVAQSGGCSPALAAAFARIPDVPMADEVSEEFAFRSNATGLVKSWEGERFHEVCGADDLELTLERL